MGTNYTRIPLASEMDERRFKLIEDVTKLELTPDNIEMGFNLPIEDSFDRESIWDKFINGTNVHLGKRSSGWKFCWNFHNNKYYSNKEELLSFIRSGRVVDEYGDEWNVDEFIKMAFEWGEPDGLVVNDEYRKKERVRGHGSFWLDSEKYDDLIIDGLRVSTSTDFC
jgi:hypothetical protein